MPSIAEAEDNLRRLKENTYPGRGLVTLVTPDNERRAIVYWISARSTRGRFIRYDSPRKGSAKVWAYDPKTITNPDLELYTAVRQVKNPQGLDEVIVSNGQHTDAIASAIRKGVHYLGSALEGFGPEPDSHGTPRISAVMWNHTHHDQEWARFSILRKDPSDLEPGQAYRLAPGYGYMVHTYEGNSEGILPSFSGPPRLVSARVNRADELAENFFELLPPEFALSTLVRATNRKTGRIDWAVINKRPDGSIERRSLTV